jgi:hypothetical protein
VASFAVRKVVRPVPPESTASVVASITIIPGSGVVLLGYNIRNLASQWRARPDRMTVTAADTSRMVRVTERGPEHVSRCGSSRIWCYLVAHIASADLALGSVALITVRVCSNSNRDRFPGPITFVARGAAPPRLPRAAGVGGVVEFHVEAFSEPRRERLHRRRDRLSFLVANGADRALAARELIKVAPNTGFVPGVLNFRRLLAAVT